MSDEWFRLPDWSDDAQIEFERRLSRCRTWNRAQYLRIKGLALEAAGEIDGARELWQRVLEEPEAGIQAASAKEHLADSWRDRNPVRAEELYRELIDSDPTLNGTSRSAHLSLAELLLQGETTAGTEEAARLLDVWVNEIGSPFPSRLFRYQLVRIQLAKRRGDTLLAAREAEVALELANRGPVFPRHPTVGLVNADAKTLRELRRLAQKNRR